MHPFSILTLGIFIAGYITARWDLVTRIYELAVFAWEYGVIVRGTGSLGPCINASWGSFADICRSQSRAAYGFGALTVLFSFIFIPVYWISSFEAHLVCSACFLFYIYFSYPAPSDTTRCLLNFGVGNRNFSSG